jgi:hypothetical protein
MVADVHRQIIEHRAFGDSLQSLDADVTDGEGLLGGGGLGVDGAGERLDGERHQAEKPQLNPHATTTEYELPNMLISH